MLKESTFLQLVNRPSYPFRMTFILLALALLLFLVFTLFGGGSDLMVMAGGTELFLYMLANAVSGLAVTNLERFVGRSFLAYFFNLVILAGMLVLFNGGMPDDLRETYPVYLALIVSFLLSMGLVILIRQVLSFLREK
jgi:hypothetical protein